MLLPVPSPDNGEGFYFVLFKCYRLQTQSSALLSTTRFETLREKKVIFVSCKNKLFTYYAMPSVVDTLTCIQKDITDVLTHKFPLC